MWLKQKSFMTMNFLFYSRYQFFLQIKQDILQGRLPVSFDLAAELGAYVVQCKLQCNKNKDKDAYYK